MKNKNRLINYLLDIKGLEVTERYLLAFRLKKLRSKTKAKKFYCDKGKRKKFWEGLK